MRTKEEIFDKIDELSKIKENFLDTLVGNDIKDFSSIDAYNMLCELADFILNE
jgi:hypothetical protein|tara:strand:- start:108 stop:266 length:159 start_codon:yes stop_codon:yes gene_type:complete